MPQSKAPTGSATTHRVWDRSTRVFHWINFLCVLALAVLGLAILNEKSFGVSGDGKLLLKTLHVYVGYVFALNLAWRLVWGFVGGRYARWGAIVPWRRGFAGELSNYVRGAGQGSGPVYLGHNPLGRLMVTLLLLLMTVQAGTGLVLAGTDLYMPPFGGIIADWVTAGDPDRLAALVPGSKDAVDPAAYQAMRDARKPVVTTHEYVFYGLMVAVLLHIVGVVVGEFRERVGLVSAMITGEKTVRSTPVDGQDNA